MSHVASPSGPTSTSCAAKPRSCAPLPGRGDPVAAERLTRHHPRPSRPGEVSLAAAQLVIAHELAFSSWPKLKAASGRPPRNYRKADARVQAFLAASIEGRMKEGRRPYFEADTGIAELHDRGGIGRR